MGRNSPTGTFLLFLGRIMTGNTGDYSLDKRLAYGKTWDGLTCIECGSISSAAFCGDCLEDGILLEQENPIEEPQLETKCDPVKFVCQFIVAGALIFLLLSLAVMAKELTK